MPQVGIVGTIVDKERRSEVQWIISSHDVSGVWQLFEYFQSPPFHFLRSSWYLRFYPQTYRLSRKNINVRLVRDDITNQEFPLTLRIRFRLCHNKYRFYERSETFTFHQDYKICNMKWDDHSSPNDRFYCWAEAVDTLDTEIVCSVAEEHPQTMDTSSICTRRFSVDIANLFLRSRRSDMSIITNTSTYPAHKLILKARSPFFKLMFTLEMKESKENVLNFKDYDDATVQHFIEFLYTGKLKSCDSYLVATCLYNMADLYEMEDLKIRSRQIIEQKMCGKTIFNIIQLANLHSDSILMKTAKIFLNRNFRNVLYTEQWSRFLDENESLAIRIRNQANQMPPPI